MDRSSLPNPPSVVESGRLRFLIFDAPNDENLPIYIHELKKHNVKHLVRACDPTYSTEPLRREGIDVHDMPFPDGGAPSDGVIDSWLKLLTVYTKSSSSDDGGSSSGSGSKTVKDTIGIHCVAGLGRAPVLVAIALIESGMPPLQAVDFIRDKRRGSINMRQLQFLKTYKSKKKGSCIVM